VSEEPHRRVETIGSRLTGLLVTIGFETLFVVAVILVGLAVAALIVALS
jgi:hypothetical protein